MLNLKQGELAQKLMDEVQKRFPEVELVNIVPGPENPSEIWIRVTAPEDEDREIELTEFSADKGMDILLNYGYHFLIIPVDKLENNGLQSKRESVQIAD